MYKDINFSLWCDYLEKDFIGGEFSELVRKGYVNGATSNPSIFNAAFSSSNSTAYELQKQHNVGETPKKLYEILATSDVKLAANVLLKNFANDEDGFVSLEVDPRLKNDAKGTLKEGERLYATIKMPNVMIKVPATKAGYKAMTKLMKNGINVNATLVFSAEQVKKCLEALDAGTEEYRKRFPRAPLPKAVISVFVSRFDRLLDAELVRAGLEPFKFGINNATLAYNLVQSSGLSNVRALFASTGAKDPSLPADYYVRELLFPNVVNTAPVATIKAFVAQKYEPKSLLEESELDAYFVAVKKAGIDYDVVCKKLLKDGLKAFEIAFAEILSNLK